MAITRLLVLNLFHNFSGKAQERIKEFAQEIFLDLSVTLGNVWQPSYNLVLDNVTHNYA